MGLEVTATRSVVFELSDEDLTNFESFLTVALGSNVIQDLPTRNLITKMLRLSRET